MTINKKYEQLRADFPILKRKVHGYPLVYCDNASTTQKPQQVIDAMVSFYTTSNANVYRSIHSFAEEATQQYEQARGKVATFISADADEIVFTGGCTSGINFIAATWADKHIAAEDEIVITELEHHANLIPWQQVAQKKGAVLRFIPVLPNGTLDLSFLDKIITKKTKLVSVVHVSNAIGTHNDVETIIAHAHRVGARVLIDAAQSVFHQKIDVKKMNADFLVFSGHKMAGPTGIGVLFLKKELHDQTPPYEFGGGMVSHVGFLGATWLPAPHKFEAGTPPIAQAIGLGAAIDYIQENIDYDELQEHEAQLCARLIDAFFQMEQIRLLGPLGQLKQRGHMVSFLVEGMHSHDVAAFFDSQGIAVRAGHHCAQPFAIKLGYDASVRASFSFYNTIQDVDRLIATMRQLLRL